MVDHVTLKARVPWKGQKLYQKDKKRAKTKTKINKKYKIGDNKTPG
jgi:hypothetical protein